MVAEAPVYSQMRGSRSLAERTDVPKDSPTLPTLYLGYLAARLRISCPCRRYARVRLPSSIAPSASRRIALAKAIASGIEGSLFRIFPRATQEGVPERSKNPRVAFIGAAMPIRSTSPGVLTAVPDIRSPTISEVAIVAKEANVSDSRQHRLRVLSLACVCKRRSQAIFGVVKVGSRALAPIAPQLASGFRKPTIAGVATVNPIAAT